MDDVQYNQQKSYHIENLATDEQKIARLDKLLKDRKNKGDFFLPDNSFYSLTLVDKASALMQWLGLESNAKVFVDFSNDIEPAGLYFYSEGTHYILVNAKKAGNTYQSAAVLAHELMHFVLLGMYKYRLEDTNDNEKFTDIATVFCGFGVVVTNGFKYDSGWVETVGALMFGMLRVHTQSLSFGYYQPKEYAKMVCDFAKSFGIKASYYAGYFLPWTRHFLPSSVRSSIVTGIDKSDTVISTQKQVVKANLIKVGVLLLLLPLAIGLASLRGSSGSGNSLSPQDQQQLSDLKSTVDSEKAAYDSCSSQVSSEKSTLDQTNAQMDADNTAGNTSAYNALVPAQNSQTNQYNSDLAACNTTYSQYTSAVDAYNNFVNQHK